MTEEAILNRNEISSLIRSELADYFSGVDYQKIKNIKSNDFSTNRNAMNMDEAVSYLKSHGFEMKINTLYKHTANNTIQFSRFGKRKIVFSKEQLDDFIERMKK